MSLNPVFVGEAYYTAMSQKNVSSAAPYLHPDVTFKGPFAQLKGKEAVLEAAKGFVHMFNTLTIRTKFGTDTHVLIVTDMEIPDMPDIFSTASLLTVKDGLITNMELFYDSRPLVEKKDEIFTSSE